MRASSESAAAPWESAKALKIGNSSILAANEKAAARSTTLGPRGGSKWGKSGTLSPETPAGVKKAVMGGGVLAGGKKQAAKKCNKPQPAKGVLRGFTPPNPRG